MDEARSSIRDQAYFFGKLTLDARNAVLPRQFRSKEIKRPAGTVCLKVSKAEHPDAKALVIVGNVDGNEKKLEIDSGIVFDMEDPLGDVMIHAYDDQSFTHMRRGIGRVILPLAQLLQPTGFDSLKRSLFEPINQQFTLRCKFYPMGVDKYGYSAIAAKLKPAVEGIPGSGINRDAIQGELLLTLEVISDPLSKRIFYPPTVPVWQSLPRFGRALLDDNVNWWNDLNPPDIKANEYRVAASATPPLLLVLVWTDLKLAFVALCLWWLQNYLGAWSAPLFAFAGLLLNGYLVHQARAKAWQSESGPYLLYEKDVGSSQLLSPPEQLLQVQALIFNIQRILATVASVLEALSTATSCADMYVSSVLVVLGACFTLFASLVLRFVPVQTLTFWSGVAFILGGALVFPKLPSALQVLAAEDEKDRRTMFGLMKGDEGQGEDTDQGKSPASSGVHQKAPSTEKEKQLAPSGHNFLSLLQRVPCELEMAHRYIADHVIIEDCKRGSVTREPPHPTRL